MNLRIYACITNSKMKKERFPTVKNKQKNIMKLMNNKIMKMKKLELMVMKIFKNKTLMNKTIINLNRNKSNTSHLHLISIKSNRCNKMKTKDTYLYSSTDGVSYLNHHIMINFILICIMIICFACLVLTKSP